MDVINKMLSYFNYIFSDHSQKVLLVLSQQLLTCIYDKIMLLCKEFAKQYRKFTFQIKR